MYVTACIVYVKSMTEPSYLANRICCDTVLHDGRYFPCSKSGHSKCYEL